MSPTFAKFIYLAFFVSVQALVTPNKRSTAAYTAPAASGGSQLDSSAGLGEPLNVSSSPSHTFLFVSANYVVV